MGNIIGWKGLWRIFIRQKPCVELTHPLYIALPLFVFLLFTLKDTSETLELLKVVSTSIFSIFPSLAGLSLAGYTIIVGGIQPLFLKRLAKHDNREKTSLLENLNVTFAFALISAIIVLLLAFIVNLLCSVDFKINPKIAYGVNFFGLVLLVYFSLVCLRSLLAVIINVFNFGQALDKFVNQENADGKCVLRTQTQRKSSVCGFRSSIYHVCNLLPFLYDVLTTVWPRLFGKVKQHDE